MEEQHSSTWFDRIWGRPIAGTSSDDALWARTNWRSIGSEFLLIAMNAFGLSFLMCWKRFIGFYREILQIWSKPEMVGTTLNWAHTIGMTRFLSHKQQFFMLHKRLFVKRHNSFDATTHVGIHLMFCRACPGRSSLIWRQDALLFSGTFQWQKCLEIIQGSAN